MGMSIELEIAADFESLTAEHGVAATWNGRTFTALASRVRESQKLDVGGYVESPEITIRALKSSFSSGAMPELGDLVAVDGVEYRVTKPSNHPRSPILLLTLSTANE
jgi:hypothetical protein